MVARRFKDLREEIADRLLEPRHLRGKAEQQDPRIGNRLVLKSIKRFLGQALKQGVIFAARLRRPCCAICPQSEMSRPRLADVLAPFKNAKYSVKPATRSPLVKSAYTGKSTLRRSCKFEEPGPDRGGMRGKVDLAQRHQILKADGDDDAVDRLSRPVLFQEREKGEPAFLV